MWGCVGSGNSYGGGGMCVVLWWWWCAAVLQCLDNTRNLPTQRAPCVRTRSLMDSNGGVLGCTGGDAGARAAQTVFAAVLGHVWGEYAAVSGMGAAPPSAAAAAAGPPMLRVGAPLFMSVSFEVRSGGRIGRDSE